jgi:hypothetical protein
VAKVEEIPDNVFLTGEHEVAASAMLNPEYPRNNTICSSHPHPLA